MDFVMTRDSLGTIFRVEKRLGRGDLFEIIAHFPDGSRTTSVYSHEHYDGMGAILNESQQWSGAQLTLPLFNLKTGVSPEFLLSGLKGLRDDFTPSMARWKSLDTSAAYTPEYLAWRFFSPEDTQRLLSESRSRKISLNTFLLAAASRVISCELLAPAQEQLRWLVPVNMRRSEAERSSKRNHTSSVGLCFSKNATMSEIERTYRHALNGWRALASHTLARIVSSFPETILYSLAKRRGEKNVWIGSFSNLGVWNFPNVDPSSHWPLALSIAPPAGTPCFPVGIGIVTWQQHLSISLRLHAGLMTSVGSAGPEAILDQILVFLSESMNTTLKPMGSSGPN
jgi:hypothetical protein